MTYFIGDTHFGHEATIIHFERPFKNAEAMDRTIIENWNAVVNRGDTVYILGDFWYKGQRPVKWYLEQLYGHKILVPGNHDFWWIHNQKEALSLLDELLPPLHEIRQGNLSIVLCHYPMLEWHGDRQGSYLIHGHTHGSDYLDRQGQLFAILEHMPTALNACAQINSYKPVTLEELKICNNLFYGRNINDGR